MTVSIVLLWIAVSLNFLLLIALLRRLQSSSLGSHNNVVHNIVENSTGLLKVGQPIPDFFVTSLNGDNIHKDGLIGNPFMLVFFLPACTSCHPKIKGLAQVFNNSSAAPVILVSGQNEEDTREFLILNQIKLTTVLEDKSDVTLFEAFNVDEMPSFCIVDADGLVSASGIYNKEHVLQKLDAVNIEMLRAAELA